MPSWGNQGSLSVSTATHRTMGLSHMLLGCRPLPLPLFPQYTRGGPCTAVQDRGKLLPLLLSPNSIRIDEGSFSAPSVPMPSGR